MTQTYDTKNGAKPRYDGGGTEFGDMHRDLGPGYLMFDIDRLSATIEMGLELKREEEGWVEYRRKGDNVTFVAMMEVKRHRTKHSEAALDTDTSNSLARLELARLIGARLFVVFGTNGNQPFDFYEIDKDSGEPEFVGRLEYDDENRPGAVKTFWYEKLGITRWS